jgi:hypothetical protein
MTRRLVLCALGCLAGWTGAVASVDPPGQPQGAQPPVHSSAASPRERWGVKAVALRPTFGGRMLDFRYKVLDPAKARALFDWKIQPYLYDPARGVALGLPGDTSIGALRASVKNPPVTGKQYFVLFSNAYHTVKKGDKVTVVMGDCKFTDVIVE